MNQKDGQDDRDLVGLLAGFLVRAAPPPGAMGRICWGVQYSTQRIARADQPPRRKSPNLGENVNIQKGKQKHQNLQTDRRDRRAPFFFIYLFISMLCGKKVFHVDFCLNCFLVPVFFFL
jgi:hypothetical protein